MSGRGEDLVVIIHGLGSSSQSFAPFLTALESLPACILAPEIPGHGLASSASQEYLTIEGMAEYVSQMIAGYADRCSSVHLVGHSLGGAVGLDLVGISPIPVASFVNVEGNLISSDCGSSRVVAASPPEDALRAATTIAEAQYAATRRPCFLNWARSLQDSSPQALHRTSESLVAASDSGRLLRAFMDLEIPKVYVYGADSANDEVLDHLGDTATIRVADADHFPMEDQPGPFTRAVIEWMRPHMTLASER